jgi:hypothetical protein
MNSAFVNFKQIRQFAWFLANANKLTVGTSVAVEDVRLVPI